jgi:AcrR family transcriptional regulator
MARPRLHTPDLLLDAAEQLIVEQGRRQLTVRALAQRTGASNGSIYHAFGSVDAVVASAWLRRAERFLALQRAAVDAELSSSGSDAGRRAVLAAADSPARLAAENMPAAQLLTALTREEVLVDSLDASVADRLRALDGELGDTFQRLAAAVRQPLATVVTCVVRLPVALLFPGIRAGAVTPLARAQLAASVGAVLDCGS